VCGGVWLVVRYVTSSSDEVKVGDCLADDPEERPPYRRVSCEDGAARYRVLTVNDGQRPGANPCVDVPGASRLFDTEDNAIVCIGDKDADPAKSANIAREGDCLQVRRDADAQRLDCGDPATNFQVLSRLTDVFVGGLRVPGAPDDGPCSDEPSTVSRFGYQWRSEDATPRAPGPAGRHYDLLFCLARVHEPPPAVPDAAVNCRFVAAEALLAAVNLVAGNRYRGVGPGHANGTAPCTYPLIKESGGADAVTIEMTGTFDWPPPDREQFTLDGLPAAWRANPTGVGYLSVAQPGGNFEVVLSFDGGSSWLRDAAVEIYRAAAPHLP
jgi:hypothetical protein